jgi:hypothetical protein
MKAIKYYGFNSTSKFGGNVVPPIEASVDTTIGEFGFPGDVLKLAHGSDAWAQEPQHLFFLNSELVVSKVESGDWTEELRHKWFKSYLRYCKLEMLIGSVYYDILYDILLQQNMFQMLSGPSIAYVNRDSVSQEVSIGMNVYEVPFVYDYAVSLPSNSSLRNIVLSNHRPGKVLVSNACKVDYLAQEEVVWCFDGVKYKYNLSALGFAPTLTTGGGDHFGEVKLAGNGVYANYIIKKNIDKDDPTIGLCSGVVGPFCMGDEIVLIDTSVWSTYVDGVWSWVGDFTQFDYIWHIADITNPCKDYRNVPAYYMRFPLRVVQNCKFDDFN